MLSSTSEAERPKRFHSRDFPDEPEGGGAPPSTIANIRFLLNKAGITAHYDVIRKRHQFRTRLGRDVTMNEIISLGVLNGMRQTLIGPFALDVAEQNPLNPVADWIRSSEWDGTDRLSDVYATVHTAEGFPDRLKVSLLHRWLLSAVAAALKDRGFSAHGVLTFQGDQGIGKTSWGRSLIPEEGLRDQVFKSDLHLDPGNKDSIMNAISSWIAEIGELDSSFRKDVARLKGFLTREVDPLRVPYARSAQDYQRRTVFFATVNDPNFLVDATGNRRWWTIPVTKLEFQHSIHMQQVFAQLAVEFHSGEQWWLTAEEETLLSQENQKHQVVSVIAERIHEHIDVTKRGEPGGAQMTAIEVLRELDIKYPTNAQCKECGAVLRQLLGPPKRIQGRDRWRVHRHPERVFTRIEDEEVY